MYISDDGIKLHVELEKPENAPDKMPLVIVIHGFTGHMEEDHIVAAAKACREQGYATLRAEMYGHGQSEGAFKDHTLFKWISNAIAVIEYARSLDFVTDIYLCGHSQGGLNVMLAGGMKHEIVKGIIELAPAAMIPEFSRKGSLLGIDFDPDNMPDLEGSDFKAGDMPDFGGSDFKAGDMPGRDGSDDGSGDKSVSGDTVSGGNAGRGPGRGEQWLI